MSNPEKIALLTDSTADLTPAMREGKPIYVVPLKIRCDDGEFSDGVDIFAQDVYDRLHRGELPRTSLPEGGVVSDTLDQIRADGYEKVIAVMLSGGLSGTCNLVRVQAEQRDDLDIAVFDSRSGSLGIGIIVLQLWEEIQAGAGWDKLIHERVPHLVDNTFPFFSVDTLEYLRRGAASAASPPWRAPCCPSSPSSPFPRTASSRALPRCGDESRCRTRLWSCCAASSAPASGTTWAWPTARAGGDGGAVGEDTGPVPQFRPLLGGGHGRHPQRLHRRRGDRRRHPVY